ncbi:hypothetical protein NQ314_004479 [Rhamnusium bicolor]|uniref:Ubiquitin-like domain-containing protein n=1 Tax=Rhamnusium bicolor TaxID=1586634 RepID=A0AAV8ZKN2_9CUCU|nr:hypothetical protein NQ314_004479 [Rhamnusium bicolor]
MTKKLTIFTDAKDTTTVLELKKIIEGILKIPPQNQQLFNKDNTVMEDSHIDDNGTFEHLDLVQYSAPPDLPDVMKSQESNGQEQSS